MAEVCPGCGQYTHAGECLANALRLLMVYGREVARLKAERGFDRKAYQRELMRKRRAEGKA